MSGFPTSIDSFPTILQTDQQNTAGKELDVVLNALSSSIVAAETRIGVAGTSDTASLEYRLTNAGLLAPVQSVAGRTGSVTLAVADVSGAAPAASPALTGVPTAPTASPGTSTTQIATTAFAGNAASTAQSNAIAACPAETASTVGNLIAGASEKSVIATADKIALSDSASSGILKWGSTADILQALYLLGTPLTIFQSAICSAESVIMVLPEVTTTT